MIVFVWKRWSERRIFFILGRGMDSGETHGFNNMSNFVSCS